jgi:D-aminopeptidase
MTAYPAGRRNSITDVAGVRVGHLTIDRAGDARRVRTGLTAIFTCPPQGNVARPAAIATLGGRTEMTGLNFVDDFGFLTSPIVAVGIRSLGRVYDAMLSRRTRVPLGWPPIVVGFDDARVSEQRRALFTDDDVAATLDAATDDQVAEGAVGAAAGLLAFGYKSGVGSASRQLTVDHATYVVGALALLNLGRRDGLRAARPATTTGQGDGASAGPLRGSALVVIATSAPLDDRQCKRVASTSLLGVGRIGTVPAGRDGLIACAVSTGVLLARNDRNARELELPRVSEMTLGAVVDAAADAAEEAAVRTLTMVKREHGTAEHPALPENRAQELLRRIAR